MSQDLWNAVDHFIADTLLGADPAQDATLAESEAAGFHSEVAAPARYV